MRQLTRKQKRRLRKIYQKHGLDAAQQRAAIYEAQ